MKNLNSQKLKFVFFILFSLFLRFRADSYHPPLVEDKADQLKLKDLPVELHFIILEQLEIDDLKHMRLTSKYYQDLVENSTNLKSMIKKIKKEKKYLNINSLEAIRFLDRYDLNDFFEIDQDQPIDWIDALSLLKNATNLMIVLKDGFNFNFEALEKLLKIEKLFLVDRRVENRISQSNFLKLRDLRRLKFFIYKMYHQQRTLPGEDQNLNNYQVILHFFRSLPTRFNHLMIFGFIPRQFWMEKRFEVLSEYSQNLDEGIVRFICDQEMHPQYCNLFVGANIQSLLEE